MELQEFIEDIRGSLEEIFGGKGEMAVRQGIIDPFLRSLGWDTTNIQIVYPEYGVGSGRVDYALCYPLSEPRVFIEAKALGEIDKAEEQLFRYDSYIRVPIAVATDGQKWIFFHPTGRGTRSERKVRELDLTLASSEESAKCLEEYLSYEAIQTGEADESIRRDYENLVSHRKVANHLPGAWKNLLEKEDELLLEIVADAVKGLCGHTPSNEQVRFFLNSLERKADPPKRPTRGNYRKPERKSPQITHANRNAETRLHVTMSDQTEISYDKALDTFCEVLQRFGLERVHEIEPGVVSKVPFHNRKHRQVDGYWINANNGTTPKKRILDRIARKLGFGGAWNVKVIDK